MDKHRCFLAIRLPEYDLNGLYNQLAGFSKVKLKLVDPTLFHLTMHFFGDLTNTQINDLQANVETINLPPFDLSLAGSGKIPAKGKNTRVLYIGIHEGKKEISTLGDKISLILKENSFQVQRKKFLPHLTIARIRGGYGTDDLVNFWMNQKIRLPIYHVAEIQMVKSTLTAEGPLYENIFTIPLQGE